MHPTLHEFADFVGRCLARLWLRERGKPRETPTSPEKPRRQAALRLSGPTAPAGNGAANQNEPASDE